MFSGQTSMKRKRSAASDETVPVDEFVPVLFIDQLDHDAEGDHETDAPLLEELEDAAWPWHKVRDAVRLADRRAKLRNGWLGTSWGYARPNTAEEQVALNNTRDANGMGSLTERQWFALRRAYQHRCAYCECPVANRPTLEHVRPLCVGGRTEFSNVVPSCSWCNREKGTKDVSEWLDSKELAAFQKKHAECLKAARGFMRGSL